MAAAATPYVSWMHTTAAQTNAAAAGCEAAFAATVPPRSVATKRALLTRLIALNILGQNAAALREYVDLRECGMSTDTEFNRYREWLMSWDPLSGR